MGYQSASDRLWLALIERDPRYTSRRSLVQKELVADLVLGGFPQRILRQLPPRLRRWVASKEGHDEPLRG